MTEEEIARAIDAHEAAALTDLVASLRPEVAAQFGASVAVLDGATAIAMPGTQTAYFNRVVGLGVFEPASEETVARMAELYAPLDTAYMVHVSPLARPLRLPEWLPQHGLSSEADWVTICRGDEPVEPAEAEFRIEPVSASNARRFAELLCAGYGMPDEWYPLFEGLVTRHRWHNFMLYDASEAVGTGSLFVDHGLARLCNGSVVPSHRRRGAHVELLRHRIELGLTLGCTLFTGETWQSSTRRVNPARRSHAHFGIQAAYVRHNYLARPEYASG